MSEKELERYSTDGPICPYCEHKESPDEDFYFNERWTEHECGECEKTYNVSVYHSTSWTTSKQGPITSKT